MDLVKVKNEPYLVKDKNSKGIISIDYDGLKAYKKQRQAYRDRTEEIENLKKDVSDIKNTLSEITSLLKNINNKV